MHRTRLESSISLWMQRNSLESGPLIPSGLLLCHSSHGWLLSSLLSPPHPHYFISPMHWLFSGQSGFSITQIRPHHSHSWNSSMTSHNLGSNPNDFIWNSLFFFLCPQPSFQLLVLPSPRCTHALAIEPAVCVHVFLLLWTPT